MCAWHGQADLGGEGVRPAGANGHGHRLLHLDIVVGGQPQGTGDVTAAGVADRCGDERGGAGDAGCGAQGRAGLLNNLQRVCPAGQRADRGQADVVVDHGLRARPQVKEQAVLEGITNGQVEIERQVRDIGSLVASEGEVKRYVKLADIGNGVGYLGKTR